MTLLLAISILALPLLGALAALLLQEKAEMISQAVIGLALIASLMLLWSGDTGVYLFEWLPGIQSGFSIDRPAVILMVLVCFVSLMVHVFSMIYMQEEAGVYRYYAMLGFFTSSMLGLLLASDLILLFVFWELVGLASYLLIGYWYRKEGVPSSARLAFMVNRMADVLLLMGILLVYAGHDTTLFSGFDNTWMVLPSILIVLGAFGKSAQLPYSGWLTKAMVGPTPVSALIHAATMVAAGVYLLFRASPFLSSEALYVVAVAGVLTALYGGLSAIGQNDIKRVLAYSTISQLGYMVAGIGVGAGNASLFHLWTHGFFKAGLFLGAGSVIHFMHLAEKEKRVKLDPQDMRTMGGLRDALPWTFRTFLVCSLALAGLPFFSGFLSKEGIILSAWAWADSHGSWAYLMPDLLFITSLVTAFYVARMVVLVFFGESRLGNWVKTLTYKENGRLVAPLVLLSMGSIWVFYQWNPFGHHSNLLHYLGGADYEYDSFSGGFTMFFSIVLAVGGISLGYFLFRPQSSFGQAYKMSGPSDSITGKALFNGLYLVNIYQGFGKSCYVVAKRIGLIDRRLLDRVLHFVAIGSVVFAKGLAIVDRFVVDGLVSLLAWISSIFGKLFSVLHARESQVQLFWVTLGVILILSWILLF